MVGFLYVTYDHGQGLSTDIKWKPTHVEYVPNIKWIIETFAYLNNPTGFRNVAKIYGELFINLKVVFEFVVNIKNGRRGDGIAE